MVKGGLGQGPARIERLHRGQSGVGGRDDEGPHPLAGPGDDDDLVGALGGQDGELLSGEEPPALGRLGGHGDVVQPPGPRVVGQRHRPGDGTGRDAGEELLLLLGRADLTDDGGELGHGGQQGAGGDRPAELLHHDSRFQNGQPDTTELRGDGQGGPVEGDHGTPQLLGGVAGLDNGAHEVDGAFLLEERADRGTQLLLLTRELELHRTPSPAPPVATPNPVRRLVEGRQVRASVPDAHVSLSVQRSLPADRFSMVRRGRMVGPGVRPSVAQARDGTTGADGGQPPEHRGPLAYTLRCASSSTAEQRTLNPQVSGSNPEGRTRKPSSER